MMRSRTGARTLWGKNMSMTTPRPATVARLKNVAALLALAETLQHRQAYLPALGVFSGYAGYGKSIAAQYVQNRNEALYVEVRDFWTKKMCAEAILMECGVARPKGTYGAMMNEIIKRLGDDNSRLLIVDEADKLVDRNAIELVRDIYEGTHCPVLLIGEELLPQKLEKYERVHSRVLGFELAMPCDLDDTRALAQVFCRHLSISDPLLERVRATTRGNARLIAITLNEMAVFAAQNRADSLDEMNYTGRVYSGESPKRFTPRRAA
jgi:DNA transposition AAA+ family ATPase